MAYLNSLIGYTVGTLSDPAVVTRSDSAIGFISATLVSPTPPVTRTDSQIGSVMGTLKPIHKPIAMLTSTGYRRTVIRMYDGTNWR